MQTQTEKSNILVEERGHLLLMGINCPEKHNSFVAKMLGDLALANARLKDVVELRCGVLSGVCKMYTAGLDLAKVAPVIIRKVKIDYSENAIDPFGIHTKRVRAKPLVAAVRGKYFVSEGF